MNTMLVTARFRIHDGKLDEFKAVAAKFLAVTREKDPATRQYDWFLSADQTECVVQEAYDDADGFLAHLENVSALFPEFDAIAESALEVFGEQTDALRHALDGMGAKNYSFLQGL